MNHGTERNRKRWEQLTPEQRDAAGRIRARQSTPEYRAEEERVRESVQEEFPPLAADPALLEVISALRAERERQGLSLTDVMERSKIDRATINKLENGKIPNPTYSTMNAYAHAIGMRLAWKVEQSPVKAAAKP